MNENMYLCSDLQESTAIRRALLVKNWRDTEREQLLALCRNNVVEFYDIVGSELQLIDVQRMSVSSRGLEILAAFTDESGHVNVVGYTPGPESMHILKRQVTSNDWALHTEIKLTFTAGLQKTMERDPIILLDPLNERKRFLVLHLYEGYVTTVFLTLSDSPSATEQTITSYLGPIVVIDMVFLKGTGADVILAVLYRDHTFDHYLRYYKLSDKGKFELNHQFNAFDVPPGGIVALEPGGVMVMSGFHAIYFPSPNTRIAIPDQHIDSNLLHNGAENIITTTLPTDNACISQLTCFANIDDTRVMAIAKSGMAFLIHIDHVWQQRTLQIKSIKFIELDYATVCKAVLYLGNGEFFGYSNLSRSCVFLVMPTAPYIHVSSYFQASPPVVSLEVANNQVYTCQGGYYSGEFRNISRDLIPYHLRRTKLIRAATDDPFKILGWHEAGLDIIGVFSGDHKIQGSWAIGPKGTRVTPHPSTNLAEFTDLIAVFSHTENFYVLTKRGVFQVGQEKPMHEGVIVSGAFGLGVCIFLSTENGSYVVTMLYLESGEASSLPLDVLETERLVDFRIAHDSTRLFAMAVFNGRFSVLGAADRIEELTSGALEGAFEGGLIYDESKLVLYLFFLLEIGYLVQAKFELDGLKFDPYKSILIPVSSTAPLRLALSKNCFVLFGNDHIDVWTLNALTEVYECGHLPISRKNITDVKLSQQHLVVLYDTGNVEVIARGPHEARLRHSTTNFSNMLNLKSIVLSNNLSVVLCYRFDLSEDQDEVEKASFLRFIDLDTMEQVGEAIRLPCKDAVDMCMSRENTLVVLDNQLAGPIHEFQIEHGRMKNLPMQQSIQGLDDATVELHSIKSISDNKYLVSGNKVFIVEKLTTLAGDTWCLISNILKQPVFASDSSVLAGKMATLDVCAGCQMLEVLPSDTMDDDGEKDHGCKIKFAELSRKGNILLRQPTLSALTLAKYEFDQKDVECIFSGDTPGGAGQTMVKEYGVKDEVDQVEHLMFEVNGSVNALRYVEGAISPHFESLAMDDYFRITPLVVAGSSEGGVRLLSCLRSRDVPTLSACLADLGADLPLSMAKEEPCYTKPFEKYLELAAALGQDALKLRFPICSDSHSLIQRIVHETAGVRSQSPT